MYHHAKFYADRCHRRRDSVTGQRKKQELSYRQQIARQLRTRYAEGIYSGLAVTFVTLVTLILFWLIDWLIDKYYTVTLKSRLSVTQGHRKRNHWIDHTRLTIRWVIGRWILSWPWNVCQGHSRSLKLVPFENVGAVSYSPSVIAVAVSVAVCEIFNVKEWRDLENQVRGLSRSLKMAPFDRSYTTPRCH